MYELKNLTVLKQQETNKTITFNPSMSASDINTLIENAYKDLNYNCNLYFQFNNGTYNLNENIIFSDFRGNGKIYIQGDMTENSDSLHTNQNVILDFSNVSNTYNFVIYSCNINALFIYNLNIKINSNNGWSNGIRITTSSAGFAIKGCYLQDIYNNSELIYINNTNLNVRHTYFSNGESAIFSDNGSSIVTQNNKSINGNPKYGLIANQSGKICKISGSDQPIGSISNELESNGGEIR